MARDDRTRGSDLLDKEKIEDSLLVQENSVTTVPSLTGSVETLDQLFGGMIEEVDNLQPVAPMSGESQQGMNQQPFASMSGMGQQGINQQPVAPMSGEVQQGMNQQPIAPMSGMGQQGMNQQPVVQMSGMGQQQVMNQQPVAPMSGEVQQGMNQQPVAPMSGEVQQGMNQQPIAPMSGMGQQGMNQQPVVQMSGMGQQQVMNQQPVAPMSGMGQQQVMNQQPIAPMSGMGQQQVMNQQPVTPMSGIGQQQVMNQQPIAPMSGMGQQQVMNQQPIAPMSGMGQQQGMNQQPVAPLSGMGQQQGMNQQPVAPLSGMGQQQGMNQQPIAPMSGMVMGTIPITDQPSSTMNNHQNEYTYDGLNQPQAKYRSYKKQFIAVHSPKGGVGKSTISKELANAFGSVDIDGTMFKVLIVDADWEFGDVATLFNVPAYPNVSEWIKIMLQDRKAFGKIPSYPSQEIVNRFMIHYNNNIDILAGSGNATDASLIDEDIVNALIDNLKRCDYDFIIFDNANSIHPKTVIPLMRSDIMVLVETLDTTTITETTVLLETLHTKQFDFTKLRMVLNQVPQDDKKLDISVSEVSRLLKLDIIASIPEDGDIRLFNNAGASAILGKETATTREIKKIANSIMPIYETKKKGLFSRIFKSAKKNRR